MDYTSIFNIAGKAVHTVMDVSETLISLAQIPIGTVGMGAVAAIGTGYLGLGFSYGTALWTGGIVASLAFLYFTYRAYTDIGTVFNRNAQNDAAPEKTALIIHPAPDHVPA